MNLGFLHVLIRTQISCFARDDNDWFSELKHSKLCFYGDCTTARWG
jgi:hypothetical protein